MVCSVSGPLTVTSVWCQMRVSKELEHCFLLVRSTNSLMSIYNYLLASLLLALHGSWNTREMFCRLAVESGLSVLTRVSVSPTQAPACGSEFVFFRMASEAVLPAAVDYIRREQLSPGFLCPVKEPGLEH